MSAGAVVSTMIWLMKAHCGAAVWDDVEDDVCDDVDVAEGVRDAVDVPVRVDVDERVPVDVLVLVRVLDRVVFEEYVLLDVRVEVLV